MWYVLLDTIGVVLAGTGVSVAEDHVVAAVAPKDFAQPNSFVRACRYRNLKVGSRSLP